MKIKFTCRECFLEGVATYDSVQVINDDLHSYTCSKGHKNVYFLKNEKFELLMESAVYAIIDGYYREAVSSMTSSYERLQEFALKILFRKNGLYDEIFNKAWKEVSQQSERQLGAFIFLYTLEYKKTPDSLTNNERRFRNDVIHKGEFPSYANTIEYCKRITDLTYSVLETIRSSDEQIIYNLSEEKQQSMLKRFEEMKIRPFTHLERTFINLHHHISSFEKKDLEIYIEEIMKKKYA
ncbi:hypothetical protein V6B16_03750 [Salinimicrobium catena]|uniref:hypothetical protein n=1 Tax=Salinimicrobium catena TaxID=390640 RepID=UPI002FE431BD